MAEKRILTTPIEDYGAVKRLRTDSGSDDDPLSDLTDDQLAVLFTMMLCLDRYGKDIDDAVMGNIDVLKSLGELCDKGHVTRMSDYDFAIRCILDSRSNAGYVRERLHGGINRYEFSDDNKTQVMRHYVKKYLNSDMDKEFFLSVASDRCLQLYAETFFHPQTEENCPITLMRVIMGSEVKMVPQDNLPPAIKSLTEVRNFVLDWCQKEKIDPIPWADKVSNERVKSFYSASTILQPSEKELLDIPKDARSILFCILMSTGYSITVDNDNWRMKLAEIREKFCMSEAQGESEDLDTINELVERLAILKKSGQRVTFTSENIKHKVMAEFVICCLKTDKDYKSYLRMSSDDSVIEYYKFWRNCKITNERCLYIPGFLEDLFTGELKLLADLEMMADEENIKMYLSYEYEIPFAVWSIDDVMLTRFVETVIGMGIDRANLNSVLCSIFIFHHPVNNEDAWHTGSHENVFDEFPKWYNALKRARQLYLAKQKNPESCYTDVLNQQMYIDRGTQQLSLSTKEWATLIFILLADNYIFNIDMLSEARQRSIQQAFPLLQDVTLPFDVEGGPQLEKYDRVLTTEHDKKIIRFASNEIRHQVMSYFVLNCLKTDEDYNNYIRLSSVDSLLEYVRTWGHMRKRNERCLYLKEAMLDNFVEKLGLDSLRHVMVNDWDERKKFQKKVNIPWEIFNWDYEARCRYVLCAKKGTQTIHRARAMIVGCAGAGKTTLLKRLRKCSQEEINKVKSTVGLEIHEDIFEIADEENVLRALQEESNKEGKQLLSIVDFAGQCAYYACHQVYLSRRAFYLLVIDMSKPFSEKVDPKLCEQAGTMFTDWTYGEYLLFWMKSVHTYCDDDTPVIIVGTHLDKTSGQTSDTLFNKVLEHLEFNKELKTHLDRKRCFVLGFQAETDQCMDTIAHLEKCIVSITKESRWKEIIPTDWALCEVVLREHRREGKKMMSVSDLTRTCFGDNKEKYSQIQDVLKLYHDMGVVLYFHEEPLNVTVIIDIQWFVDSFKNVITDPNHVSDVVENKLHWREFFETGHLQDSLLSKLLAKNSREIYLYEPYEMESLPSMSSAMPYEMESLPSMSSVMPYKMELQSSMSSDMPYKMESPPSMSSSTPYKMESQPTKSNVMPYKMELQPSMSSDMPYKMESPPFMSSATPYKMEAQPTKSNALPYKMESQPSMSSAMPYKMESPPSMSSAMSYKMESPPSMSSAMPYKMESPPSMSSVMPYYMESMPSMSSVMPVTPQSMKSHWDWNLDKSNLLLYMQRLGLIAVGRFSHYIPSMNKRTFGAEEGAYFEALRFKTSVLVYKFHFLPYFYYFRLIVACLENKEWNILENRGQCLYKNVACFMYKDHVLVLAVTKSSIQLQILQPENKPIEKEVVLQVRDTVDMLLRKLTQNFHKNLMFIVGYQCSKQEVFVEHDDCFIKETEIYGKGEIPCPRHGMMTYHRINEQGLLSYWKKDVLPMSARHPGESTVLEEKDLPKFIKLFGKDIYIQALYLSLSGNEIEIIRMESPNSVPEQVLKILLKWKHKKGQGATIKALREALQQFENDTRTTVDWEAFHTEVKSIVD